MPNLFEQFVTNCLEITLLPFTALGYLFNNLLNGSHLVLAIVMCLLETVIYVLLWRLFNVPKPMAPDDHADRVPEYVFQANNGLYELCCFSKILLVVGHLATYKTFWLNPEFWSPEGVLEIFALGAALICCATVLILTLVYVTGTGPLRFKHKTSKETKPEMEGDRDGFIHDYD